MSLQKLAIYQGSISVPLFNSKPYSVYVYLWDIPAHGPLYLLGKELTVSQTTIF